MRTRQAHMHSVVRGRPPRDNLSPIPREAEVVVIGGGVTGCSAAYYLARAGVDVILLERHDLNTQASGRNAGGLHGQIQHEPFFEMGESWGTAFGPSLRLMQESIDIWSTLEQELDADLE